jgi:hypothetical protein
MNYIGNLLQPRTVMFLNFISSYWYSYFFKFFHFYIPDSKYLSKFKLQEIKRAKKIDLE